MVLDASDVDNNAKLVDMVFCAVNMKKKRRSSAEEAYAQGSFLVISNNSANRKTPDVPMVIPEINPQHLEVIQEQRTRLGTKRGFIAVKPNCSIQAYVPMLTPPLAYHPTQVVVTTYQAISGAGKTFHEWEENAGQYHPLHLWRGGKERARASADLGSGVRRQNRTCGQAR